MNPFQDQAELMQAYGQEYNTETAKLYLTLIQEECVQELIPAADKYFNYQSRENLTELVDGCVDTIVVVSGLLNALVGHDKAKQAWEEVFMSNRSKAVLNDDGTRTVIRREDGKALKPPSYSPPDLFSIIANLPTPEGTNV